MKIDGVKTLWYEDAETAKLFVRSCFYSINRTGISRYAHIAVRVLLAPIWGSMLVLLSPYIFLRILDVFLMMLFGNYALDIPDERSHSLEGQAGDLITPEMLQAGLEALEGYRAGLELGPISSEHLVQEVWTAMYKAAIADKGLR